MKLEEIKSVIDSKFPDAVVGIKEDSSPSIIEIPRDQIHGVCSFLHENEKTYFDSLACLTGIDNGEEENTMEVVYTLYSIPYDFQIMISVTLDRSNPEVDSVTDIWRGANWHEREAYDLLGIKFNNHPDLRRILLPDDWEGHPLRKDYQEQEHYHEIKVKY